MNTRKALGAQLLAVALTTLLIATTSLSAERRRQVEKTPSPQTGESRGDARPWELQDSVALRYIALNANVATNRILPSPSIDPETSPFVVSPDGEYFFFASNWGELESDSDVTTLSVYRTQAVSEWLAHGAKGIPAPHRTVVLRSRGPRGALAGVDWDDESRTILFSALSDSGAMNGFRLDVATGALEQLTRANSAEQEIQWVGARGAGVVYSERLLARQPGSPYPAEWVERGLDGMFVRQTYLGFRENRNTLYVSFQGQSPRALVLDEGVMQEKPWFSPDGRWAIGKAENLQYTKEGRLRSRIPVALIDVKNARLQSTEGLQFSFGIYPDSTKYQPAPSAYWSNDGRRVILVNVLLPQSEATTSAEQQSGTSVKVSAGNGNFADGRAATEHYIVAFDIDSGRWQVLQPLLDVSAGVPRLVTAVAWSKAGEELLVTHETAGKPSAGTAYTFTPSGVTGRVLASQTVLPGPKAGLGRQLKIKLSQSARAPPAGSRV